MVTFVRVLVALSGALLLVGLYVGTSPAPAVAASCGLPVLACPSPSPTPTPTTTASSTPSASTASASSAANPAGNGDVSTSVGTVNAPFNPADCGPAIRATKNRNWICTFADQFSGTSVNRKRWMPMAGYPTGNPNGNWACYTDSGSTIQVSSSAVRLIVRKNTRPTYCKAAQKSTYWTSGMLTSYHLFSQQYGRFQARIKVTNFRQPGLQEAFWLWPDDRYVHMNWPTTGEIDTVELYSWKPTLGIPYLHYTADDHGGPRIGLNTARNCIAQRGVWNVYTLTWTPTRIVIKINGKTCLVNTSGDPAFKERYIINLSSALGAAANSYTGNDPRFRAVMSVDYVRVWK